MRHRHTEVPPQQLRTERGVRGKAWCQRAPGKATHRKLRVHVSKRRGMQLTRERMGAPSAR